MKTTLDHQFRQIDRDTENPWVLIPLYVIGGPICFYWFADYWWLMLIAGLVFTIIYTVASKRSERQFFENHEDHTHNNNCGVCAYECEKTYDELSTEMFRCRHNFDNRNHTVTYDREAVRRALL